MQFDQLKRREFNTLLGGGRSYHQVLRSIAHARGTLDQRRHPKTFTDSDIRGARQQPHQQLIDHGHVECIERPPASTSGLHTLRSLYH
jgi:hypothetical protein